MHIDFYVPAGTIFAIFLTTIVIVATTISLNRWAETPLYAYPSVVIERTEGLMGIAGVVLIWLIYFLA